MAVWCLEGTVDVEEVGLVRLGKHESKEEWGERFMKM